MSSEPTERVGFTLSSIPDRGVWIGIRFTSDGIANAWIEETEGLQGVVHILFRNPLIKGPGVYRDTVEVGACLEEQCETPLSGSPHRIAVVYNVTGIQPAMPQVTLSESSLSVQSYQFADTSPTAEFSYSLQNVADDTLSISASHTGSGVLSVSHRSTSAHAGVVAVEFRDPEFLGVGRYEDSITLDFQCITQCDPRGIAGAKSVQVSYAVTNTVLGENGITIRFVDTPANDLVWSTVHERIYFTVPASAAAHANSIAALNPWTGEIEKSATVGDDPNVLAVSDDGRYAYVAPNHLNEIQRKSLPSLAQDLVIPLADALMQGSMYANDIGVAPGHAATIAVARRNAIRNSSTANGVVIFDDAIARPSIAGGYSVQPALNWIQWGEDAGSIFASTTENTSFAVARLSVDASGARIISSQSGVGRDFSFGRMHYANGVLYADGGEAYDPVVGDLIGRFESPSGLSRGTVPDVVHNKLFMFSDFAIRSFNLATFSPISSIRVPVSVRAYGPLRIIRWGEDGLAWPTDDGRIVVIQGAFISGVAN